MYPKRGRDDLNKMQKRINSETNEELPSKSERDITGKQSKVYKVKKTKLVEESKDIFPKEIKVMKLPHLKLTFLEY